MRVLIIKTSSMGDVIHTLPAITDACQAISDIQFDWVVEENFAEIPTWHPHVSRVIPIALRRWRKQLFSPQTWSEWRTCKAKLQERSYDLIIDAQGLLKSAWLVWMAKGVRAGLNWQAAREPLASLFYSQKCAAGAVKKIHAVTRMRQLFSGALNYPLPESVPNYGIDRKQFKNIHAEPPYLVFLHGTTWPTKHWPEAYWIALTQLAEKGNWPVKILWGNEAEKARAERIAQSAQNVTVLPRMKLAEIASVLANAKAIVAVDTGLGHLAAALDVPTVSLYGPTNPVLTGAMGQSQTHLTAQFPCAPCLSSTCTYESDPLINPPCFKTVSPEKVWRALGL